MFKTDNSVNKFFSEKVPLATKPKLTFLSLRSEFTNNKEAHVRIFIRNILIPPPKKTSISAVDLLLEVTHDFELTDSLKGF
jgi:hypothetical protein